MFVWGNFLISLGKVINIAVTLYIWLIIIRALISWVNPDPYNPIVIFLKRSTDPVLAPLRRKIPPLGGIDFSPLIAIFILIFFRSFVVKTLIDLGMRLR